MRQIRVSPSLWFAGDVGWEYACPKCYQPHNRAIAGHGRSCPRHAPTLEYRTDGTREWFAVTCGTCGFHEEDPAPEPVYELDGWDEPVIAEPPRMSQPNPRWWNWFVGARA